MVVPDAHGRHPPHLHVALRGRLLAPQDGLGQVDGDEVREPGDRHPAQLFCRPGHIEGGADGDTRVVEQLEALTRDLGPARERPQLRVVPEGGDTARRPALAVRGPVAQREQTAPRAHDLVGDGVTGGQQGRHLRIQAELGDPLPLCLTGQFEQTARLVVDQQEPVVPAHDEDPLAHGVQYRVMVLVHPGHLGGLEPVCLAPQPPAHEGCSHRGKPKCGGGRAQEERQLTVDCAADLVDGDPRGDQADNLPATVFDRNHGLYQRADGSVDFLGQRAAGLGGCNGADELLSDSVRLGVGVADSVGVHHDDEIDAGPLPCRLRPRLEYRSRIGEFSAAISPGEFANVSATAKDRLRASVVLSCRACSTSSVTATATSSSTMTTCRASTWPATVRPLSADCTRR